MNLQKLKRPGTAIGLLGMIIFLASCNAGKSKVTAYDFVDITKGNLQRTVSATGTINPVAEVYVLPQMSGKVEKINVDYNYQVKKGDVLAELNTDMLKLEREQQNAAVIKARANNELQKVNYSNQLALSAKNLISEFELKTSKTTLDGTAADLSVAEANLDVTNTKINQYAIIKSPIDGIVLDRKINVGDTVVDSSSNNSSSMFTLAENLKAMQIQASVSELDIPSIRQGQNVRFTLESMPGRNFTGQVSTVRMVPVVTNSVVSYTVVVDVQNEDGSLLPGMTCAVDFIVEHAEDVLTIPNAALRFQPGNLTNAEISDMVFNASLVHMTDDQKQKAIAAREAAKAEAAKSGQTNRAAGLAGMLMGNRPRFPGPANTLNQRSQRGAVNYGNLWYMNNGKLEVMQVPIGITDGTSTEIRSKDNLEGKQIILREKINAGN